MKTMKKNILIPIILVEAVMLFLAGAAGIMLKKSNASRLDIPAVGEWTSEYISANDGVWTVTDGQFPGDQRKDDDLTSAIAHDEGIQGKYPTTVMMGLEDPTRFSLTLIESPAFTLPLGSYTLTVTYSASVDQYVTLRTAEEKSFIRANPATLSKNLNVIDYHFDVLKDTQRVTIAIPYNHYGDMTIRSVTLSPNMNGAKCRMIFSAILFLIADLAVWDLTHKKYLKDHKSAVYGVAIITLLSSLPLLLAGMVIGQDEYFHLMRIEGLAEAIGSGQFPVRMQSLWMDGFSYPVSVYYGDLLLYIPAFLRLAGFSINAAYKLFLLLMNLAVSTVSYQCFMRMFDSRRTALIATSGYSLATYRLVDVYVRSAIGEALSFVFYPLIAFAVWKMYSYEDKDSDKEAVRKEIIIDSILMAVGMSGLIYSHTLSVAMTAAFLLVVVLVFIKKTFTKRVIITWTASVTGTLLISAAFLIPFVDYSTSVTTNSKVNVGQELIQWSGAYLYQYLMLFQYPFGGNAIDIADRLSYTPGLILMLAFAAAIVHIILRHAKKQTVYATVFSALALWLASDMFPWDFLSKYVSESVATIQFPWRFVGIACICLSVLLGCLLDTIGEHAKVRGIEKMTSRWLPVVFMICAFVQGAVFFGQYASNDYRTSFRDTAELDPYAVTSFFLREGIADDEPLDMSYPASSGIEQYELMGRDGTTLSAYIKAGRGSFWEFPVFYYPYYRLYDESGSLIPISDGSHHLIRADFSDEYEGNITLCYREPVLWRISELISLAAVIACVALSQRVKRVKIS